MLQSDSQQENVSTLLLFLAHVLGGPGQSSAPDIHQAHAKHPIEMRHFYAVSDHMLNALYSLQVDEEIIAQVITLLEPLSREIVNTRSSDTPTTKERNDKGLNH